MMVAAIAEMTTIAPMKVIPTAKPRLRTPCASSHSTPGLERGEEDRDEDPDQIPFAAWTTAIRDDPARMIPSTTRIARGRKRTRRSSTIGEGRGAARTALAKLSGP